MPAPSPSTVPLRFSAKGKFPPATAGGRLPGLHHAVGVRRIRCADNGDIGQTVADIVAADADGMGSAGAGAADAESRTLDAVLQAHVRGRRRADETEQAQRMAGRMLELEDMR